jgi:hypothetical protein
MKAALFNRNPIRAPLYREALALAGVDSVPFTPGSPDDVGGIVLTGRADVDPALCGAAPHETLRSPRRIFAGCGALAHVPCRAGVFACVLQLPAANEPR